MRRWPEMSACLVFAAALFAVVSANASETNWPRKWVSTGLTDHPLVGKIYAPREDGVVFVASITDGGFQLLSENDMKESVIGSPIAVDDRLFLRGEKHLFCFTNQGSSQR